MEPQSIIPQKPRTRNTRATIKQVKAVKFISDGMSVRGALIKAGYSIKTANLSTRFFEKKGAKMALESQIAHLNRAGVTQEKLANKLAEFIDAGVTKTVKGVEVKKNGKVRRTYREIFLPDYKTQIEGVKLADGIFQRNNPTNQKKKREMTITEFVMGEDAQ